MSEKENEPGEVEPSRIVSKEDRAALKAFRQDEADVAMRDVELAREAFDRNRERLKAERLARDDAEPQPSTKPKKTSKKPLL